ncbi:MAG: hypothetical protein OEW15_14100 [Nitrospirota bacterium]|nr:hypothetical protein [Nitrospirota bacterium]
MRYPDPNHRSKAIIIITLFAAVLFGSAGPAGAVDDDLTKGTRSAIERSALPPAEKDLLAAHARQAVRSGIPAADVEAVVARGLERNVGSAGITGLLDLAVQAKNESMPVKALMSRIEQGLAKQVPQERIAAAVKRLVGHLAAARPVVDDLVSKGVSARNVAVKDTAVETVARAYERSIPADAVSDTAGRIIERKGSLVLFDRAVGAITDLVEFGVPADSAAGLVKQGLARGYSEKDFDRMQQQITDSIRRGKSPEDAAKAQHDDLGRDRRDDRRGGARDGGSERRGDSVRGGRGK